jgi:hypothetical protein
LKEYQRQTIEGFEAYLSDRDVFVSARTDWPLNFNSSACFRVLVWK